MDTKQRLRWEIASPDEMATHWTARVALCREVLAEIERLEDYAHRIEDHFIALGAVVSAGEESRARSTIKTERLCMQASRPDSV